MKNHTHFYLNLIGLIFSILLPSMALPLPYRSQQIAIASPSPYSAPVANEISSLGGNVFDQAVAVALSLSVTHPYYASLGGGGFALIRKQNANGPSSVEVLDFRETAPQSTTRETYIGKDAKAATDGGLASGVPGVPAGLWALHKKYGKLPWKKLFGPAVRLAEKGFPVSGEWSTQTTNEFDAFNLDGKKTFGRKVLEKSNPPKERYEPLKPGDLLKQPKLAKGLRALMNQGAEKFYQGAFAKDVVETVQKNGGTMTVADVKSYKPVWREPIKRNWRGYDVYLMPLPSSGGLIMAQAYELLDRIDSKFKGPPLPLSSQEAHFWGETLKLSFAARGLMGDPLAGSPNENLQADLNAKLLAADRLDRLAKLVDDDRAIEVMHSKSPDLKEALQPQTTTTANEKTETTHFSIADRDGNAVAFTVTLNGSYGSGMTTAGFGIALNDEMDDFNTQPGQPNQYGLIQGEANSVGPGKRPLSSMSPTIIEKDGQFFATLGAPGGPRIPSAVWQASVRLMTQKADAEEAVMLPRVHHQFLPDTLFHDARRFSPDVISKLKSYGHKPQETWVAKVYVVRRTAEGYLEAAADPRGEAAAGGH